MKKYFLLLLILSVLAKVSHSKDSAQTKFDSTYFYIATELAVKDIDLAIVGADSLFSNSSNNLEKTKCLMLLATLREQKGEISKSLKLAYAAEKIAIQEKDTEWQMRIAGYMSTTFKNIGLWVKGKEYLNKVEKINQKEKNELLSIYIHQDKAFYFLDEKEPILAINELEKAEYYMAKLLNQRAAPIIKATTYQLKGLAYLQLNELTKAKEHLNQSLELLPDDLSVLSGYLYVNLAKVYRLENDFRKNSDYLEKATPIAENSQNYRLNLLLFEEKVHFYKNKGNSLEALKFENKLLNLKKEREKYALDISNELIQDFHDKELINDNSFKNLKIIIGLLILFLVGFIIFYIRLKIKQEEKFQLILKTVEMEKVNKPEQEIESEEATEIKSKDLDIPHSTITLVLNELFEFENGESFLKNDISLSFISDQFKVNSKYVSQIINAYKEKDFNNYINELRIKYIVKKLVDDENYLNFKIAYLAEEAGFSSHSKFSSIFKQVVGTSPSVFIQKRKKNPKQVF